MWPFRRGSAEQRRASQAGEAEQAASVEALVRGELPLRAQERLGRLGKLERQLFTSDLSVSEFALVDQLALRPVSQVMGSSIYHVGWQPRAASWGWRSSAVSQELSVISEAWNEARRRAFARLEQEARLVGADAVVGVKLARGAHDWASGAIEYVAVGTAVRAGAARAEAGPTLTDLSAQDYWKLQRAGYAAVGVVGASSVYYIVPGWSTRQAQSGLWSSWANQELGDFTRGVYDAREAALGRLTAEAQALDAAGVVGVAISQSTEEREVDTGGSQRTDLVVTFHVLGTAIAARGSGGRELAVSPVRQLNGTSLATSKRGVESG